MSEKRYRGFTVTVVVPCLNEEDAIGAVLDDMPEWVMEKVVVDNASTDRTGEIARARGARVIYESVRGYGRAYKTGFAEARGDIIVTLDGDHSYPASGIPRLIDLLIDNDADFLTASRFPLMDKDAMSYKHYLGNKVLSLTLALLFKTTLEDSQSGMWVFRRSILPKIKLTSDGMALSQEIKIEALRSKDIRFKEVHIDYSQRTGEIKLRPYRDGLANLWFLFRKRFFG